MLKLALGIFLSLALLGAETFRGQALDPSGKPVENALVTFRDAARKLFRAQTNSEGEFNLEGVAAGKGQLTVERSGFEPFSREVDTAAISGTYEVRLAITRIATSMVVEDVAGKATASRMDVPNRELPVQVSAVSSEVIEEQGANDLVTALRNVSGVSAQRWYGMYEYYTIRGFNISDVVLVDGMRLEGNRINTQLNNVEQVEVLKGPSSVLYGGQALGGSINIIRKKPQGVPAYDFFYRGGRFNTHQIGGGATGQVFGLNQLLYRLDTSYEYSDGFRNAGARRFNISPTVTYLINNSNRVTVHQAFNRDGFDTDAGVPTGVIGLPNFDRNWRFNTPFDFGLVQDSQTHVLFNSNLHSNWEFRNGFFYRWTNDEYYSAEFLTFPPALNQVDRGFLYFKHHRRPVLNQSDVVGRFNLFGMKHTVLAGYEYQDFYNFTNRSASRSIDTAPINLSTFQENATPPNGFPLSRIDYFANKINAFFWQDQIAVTNRLRLNIGGRLDDWQRSARNNPWGNGQQTGTGPEQTRNQQAYTYRAGAVYLLQEDQQVYFSANSSFTPVTTIPADGSELEPETGQSYEFGHRWQALGGRLNFSTAAYKIYRQNVVIARGNQLFDQAGQQSASGIDFDLNGQLPSGVRVIANYGFTQPRFDNFFISNGAVNLSGFRPRFTQKHAANLWLTKVWKSNITTSAGVRYLSNMFTNNTNTIKLGGFTVFNGSIGYQRGFYDISLNAENLFNRGRYFVAGINDNQLFPGAPINIFTSLRFRFR
jgi:iron complex outermembrane receptor protein